MFRLEPDFLIEQAVGKHWVLDTKWKRLDGSNRQNKYGLSQADFYQLFAYGQRYLGGTGDMALIYPKWKQLNAPLPPFEFDNELRLHVLPFDLDTNELHLPAIAKLPLLQAT